MKGAPKILASVLLLLFTVGFLVALAPVNFSGHINYARSLAADDSSDNGPSGPYTINLPYNPKYTGISGFLDLLRMITKWLMVFGVAIGVIVIIVAGIMYLTSAGNTDRAAAATRSIAYAVIGIAVVLLAWGIVKIVISLFSTSG